MVLPWACPDEWEMQCREYLQWQAATEELIDRYGFGEIPQEELDRALEREQGAKMVGMQWFLETVTEAFEG